ncbi:extracellular solute-binding protein [Paenibacillus monticola]|uniref:Extracellular solute-binding protein n=1 Tax=Paenibacillus monticola TaxID=2666075 RepID=A0A7X2H5J5_9BACL|nr:extracellular solute-binding protein [Paenibacillus monticola]MRN53820.1 extracellular solute-binding protein [Paenibacillus monticola]
MNKNKQTLLLAVLMLAVTTVFSGCSSDGNSANSSSAPADNASNGTGQDTSKNIKLNVSFMGIQDGFDAPGAANDTIFNNLEKQFNVTLNPVQLTWNDYMEKTKVWAASGQLPDIFPNVIAVDNQALYASWAKQGIIKPLPEDLSKYPNIERIMSLPSVTPLKVDGKFYMIPRMTYNDSSDWIMDRPILYRKDWASEAGFTSSPNSFDEFVAMIKAVKKLHPEAVGVTLENKSYIDTQFLGSFPEMANSKSWTKEEDEWIPSYDSPRINEGLKQLRTLYSEGLLDKDFAIQKASDGTSKFLNGQSFVNYGGTFSTFANVDAFHKGNPGVNLSDAVGLMSIWPASDGKRYTFAETPYWSEIYFNNKMSDEQFDRALQLIDFMASEDYSVLVKNGILNVDYKIENGKAVSLLSSDESLATKYPVTNTLNALAQWHGALYKAGKTVLNSNPDIAAWEAYDQETFKKFKAEYTPAPINFDIMLMSTPAKNKLSTSTLIDDMVNTILGEDDPAAMWTKVLKGYESKGLNDAIKEVNDKAKELGI